MPLQTGGIIDQVRRRSLPSGQLVQACLRLSIEPSTRRLCVSRGRLPSFLTYARVCNLQLPFGKVDLLFERHPGDLGVTVLDKSGDFEIVVLK